VNTAMFGGGAAFLSICYDDLFTHENKLLRHGIGAPRPRNVDSITIVM